MRTNLCRVDDARNGNRTRTPLRERDFKSKQPRGNAGFVVGSQSHQISYSRSKSHALVTNPVTSSCADQTVASSQQLLAVSTSTPSIAPHRAVLGVFRFTNIGDHHVDVAS
jgi:hypothetical protein